MELAPAAEPGVFQAEQRDLKRPLKSTLGCVGHRGRGGGGEHPLHESHRLAGESRQPAGEARLFEPAHRRCERLVIQSREIHAL
jgi:hypothetical protein